MRRSILPLLLLSATSSLAQSDGRTLSDSLDPRTLQEVRVSAYQQNRRLAEVPASIGLLTSAQLERFGNASIVSAVNSIPGVRMEERSPGSYRLSFRGSTLRSPFGVRNVKVYLNDIPFTDAGGNTYLTQLAPFEMSSLELIKGPAGSLYGAGTGGAILIHTQPQHWEPGFTGDYTFGSFNSNTVDGQVRFGDSLNGNTITYTHQTSDGYRAHTALRRDFLSWESVLKNTGRQKLSSYASYGDLYYQTPGGLTLKEYQANRRQARPAAGAFPSAETAKAAIAQKTFLVGLTNTYQLNDSWTNTTSLYGAYTNYKNPTFRNYEFRNEPHFGGRTVFTYHKDWLQLDAGGEGQKGFFKTEDYGNRAGVPDTIQTNDNIDTWTYSFFAQADARFGRGWDITAGASYNKSFIGVNRLSVPGFVPRNRTFSNEIAPRISIAKTIVRDLLLYASVSKGFSPPTVAEVLPSTGSIDTDLNAEHGINYEAGVKTSFFGQRLYVEINGFYFRLKQAIVVRKDASNADYYTNAGATKQQGLESQLSYQLLSGPGKAISSARLWLSYTLSHFTYDDFSKNNISYSGKHLPGIANNVVAGGMDIISTPGIFLHLTYYYSDRMALDDANTTYAGSYGLYGGKIGYKSTGSHRLAFSIYTGVENAFNTHYSLGNDINATGGRYYNVAPGSGYYAGISLSVNAKKKSL